MHDRELRHLIMRQIYLAHWCRRLWQPFWFRVLFFLFVLISTVVYVSVLDIFRNIYGLNDFSSVGYYLWRIFLDAKLATQGLMLVTAFLAPFLLWDFVMIFRRRFLG